MNDLRTDRRVTRTDTKKLKDGHPAPATDASEQHATERTYNTRICNGPKKIPGPAVSSQ